MSKFQAKMKDYNETLKHYAIVPTNKCMGEDGKYQEGEFIGYAIENLDTGVVEHTTICLPAAMYQASHFDDMLDALLTPDKKKSALSLVDGSPVEDIVPH